MECTSERRKPATISGPGKVVWATFPFLKPSLFPAPRPERLAKGQPARNSGIVEQQDIRPGGQPRRRVLPGSQRTTAAANRNGATYGNGLTGNQARNWPEQPKRFFKIVLTIANPL